MQEFEFTPVTVETADSAVNEVLSFLQNDLAENREASYASADERYQADEHTAIDLDDAMSLPSLTQEEYTEISEKLTGTTRFLQADRIRLENNKRAQENGLIADQTGLVSAKREIVGEQIVNAGKMLVGEIERGKLIDQKTLGYALQGVRQAQMNTRHIELLQRESVETEALIRKAEVNIQAIQSETEQKMLDAREKALLGAGIDVDFSEVN